VHRDIDVGQTVGGTPAVPAEEWRRQSAALRRLARRAVSEPPKEPNESA
jgi:UDP-3-O-[3-hydroxymyristoyl] glucosamine N-acyltransferase